MTVELNKQNIKEIEDKMPELTNWLTSHYVDIGSVCFILQAIMKEVNKVKKEMDNE